jgi:signal transduction histidine kinase
MADRMSLVASIALAVFVGVGAVLSRQDPLVVALASVAGVAVAVVLHLTRRHLLLVSTVGAVAVAVLCSPLPSNSGWFAICVLAGICALRGGDRTGVAFTVIGLAVFVQQWVVASEETGWVTWIAGIVFTTVVCLMARRQLELTDRLRAAQAGLADRARADERSRIARELHDVIGHSLTVSLLHVSSARLALQEDPDEALAALAEAERLGRQSLEEVRHAVGLLRDADESSRTPLPGAEQLPTLVEGFRRAGIHVSYDVEGDPSGLLDTTGLTLYRILQEALTNVARHAPGAEVVVRLSVGARETVLTVHSAGRPGIPNGNGVGLHSMRERAAALGGELAAGPVDTGWQVRATLPAAPRAARVGR